MFTHLTQNVGGKIGQLEMEKLTLQDQTVCVQDLQEDRGGETEKCGKATQ